MKHHKKQYRRILIGMLLLGSMATMMHACAWDDSLYEEFVIVDDEGNRVVSCKNLTTIMIYNGDNTDVFTSSDDKFANAFTYNLCPEKAHNCIHEGNDENKPGICNNCPDKHAVCKKKCVDIMNPNLHIKNCGSDNLECKEGYDDSNNDASDGCEINGWTDKAHCGAGIIDGDTRKTGVRCEDYEVCTRGTCTESCGEDYMLVCDGQCVNTNIDNAHCGGCNATCSITANDVRAAVACQEGGCHAIACQPGYYLEDADEAVAGKIVKTCKPCADGKYTTSATATGCEECKTTTGAKSMVFDANNNICKAASCLEGYQLKDGSCEPCAPGTYSAELGATSCTPCADGHFSGLAASSCTPCQPGTYTADHIQCISCSAGQYSEEGSDTCQDCTGETISAAGSAMCAECKTGTQANYDHTACVGCNNASDCTLTTGVESMRCSKSNICEADQCKAGYIKKDGQCEPCEAGTVPWGESCFPCNANNISGLAASLCTPCPAGTHTVGDDRTKCEALECGENQHVYGNECEDDSTKHCGAPRNKCATLEHGTSACTNGQCVYTCHAGYYWKDSCGDSEGKCCIQCPAGSYCPTVGLTSPIPCPKGHYCTGGVSSPAPCPMGTYRNELSGTKEGDCSKCPKGRHNDGVGAYECALIPASYIGINCHDESKKEGCSQYSTCYDQGDDKFKCSNMYGNDSKCAEDYKCHKGENAASPLSCIVEHPGCPGTLCCNDACVPHDAEHCASCNNRCDANKTCQKQSDGWKCVSSTPPT